MNKINGFKDFDYSGLSSLLDSLDPIEFAIVASILGVLLALPLKPHEQRSIGHFFVLMGQELVTISAKALSGDENCITRGEFNDYKHNLNLRLEKIVNGIKK